MTWLITFYCLCFLCCSKPPWHPAYGITKSGRPVMVGMTAACDGKLLGKKVRIPGMGVRWCDDTGSNVVGKHVDVYVETHTEAVMLGVRRVKVEVLPK